MLNIKPASSYENYSHVFSGDPALDHEADGFSLEKFHETGDRKFLRCHPSEEPTVFELRVLGPREFTHVQGEIERTSRIESAWLCCSMALVGWSNQEAPIERTVNARGFEVVATKQMEALGLVDGLVTELGLRALVESRPKKP